MYQISEVTAEELAKGMHETRVRLAPQFGMFCDPWEELSKSKRDFEIAVARITIQELQQ